MAITKVINDAVDLNQTSDYSGLRLPVGTTGNVIDSFTTDYLVVGGGGGGGQGYYGGGGGAGGLRTSYNNSTTTTNSLSFPSGKTAIATYMLDNDATDISGNYNGTESYITYNTGKYGGGAVFNGSSSKISITSDPTFLGQNDFSISMWFNLASLGSKRNLEYLHYYGAWIDSSNQINFYGTSINTYGTAISADTWYHVVFTKSSTAGSIIYLDGSPVSTNSADTGNTGPMTYNRVNIGAEIYNASTDTSFFDGSIDQVRLYNVVLSSLDVSNIYNNEVQAPSGGGTAAESSLTLSAGTSYDVTVGSGAIGGNTQSGTADDGNNSIFSTITSDGGGGGQNRAGSFGSNGGSGGGASLPSDAGGNGTLNQGYAGGSLPALKYGAGGGGASEIGLIPLTDYNQSPQRNSLGAPGGDGLSVSITGTAIHYSGGGGGGGRNPGPDAGTSGGLGGGGDGGLYAIGENGFSNTGGGGGGGGDNADDGGSGGSGVVILRYPTASVSSFTTTGTLNTPSTTDTLADNNYPVTNTAYYTLDGNANGYLTTNDLGTFDYPSGAGTVALYEMNGNANGYLTTTDLSTVNYPAGAGCIALYELNGNANDTSNTYNGGATNITYDDGAFDQAAVFNGSSSYISANDPNSGGGARSFSAWIKTTSTGFQSIITNGGASHTSGLNMFVYNNKLYSTSGNGSGENYGPTSSADVNTGAWVHCVLTMSGTAIGSTLKTYVNGTLDGTHTTTVAITDTYNAFRIGARYINGSYAAAWFDGEIDQVRIFNTELTQSQVTTLARGAGTAYNGAENSITYDTGAFDQAAVFNGTSSYIQASNPLSNIEANQSVSFWLNLNSQQGGGGVGQGGLIQLNGKFYLQYSSAISGLRVYNWKSGKTFYDSSGTTNNSERFQYGTLNNNQWYHIVFVKNGTDSDDFVLYIDGQAQSQPSGTTQSSGGFNGLQGTVLGTIGAIGSTRYNLLDGSIDQVRIFDTALSASNVATLARGAGTASNAAPSNITWGNGKFGQAAVFNGSNSYIDTNATLIPTNATDDFSISFWINPNNHFGTILARGLVSTGGVCYGFRIAFDGTNNRIRFNRDTGVSCGSTPNANTGNNTITQSVWNHVVIIYDASANTVTFYINGSSSPTVYQNSSTGAVVSGPMASGAISFNSSYDGGVFKFGNRNNALSNSPFNGDIDQVRIFSTALSSTQATDLYNEHYQTKFTDGSDTAIVFTEGTGTVTFSGTSPTPPQGVIRANTSYSEDGSASVIEHYNGTDWKYFDATKYCTTNTLNFPSGAGCIASYNLDNNVDDIGNAYNGTNSNVTFNASGKFGAAAVFNGSGYITLSTVPFPVNNFTISAWMNVDAVAGAGSYNMILTTANSSSFFYFAYEADYLIYYNNANGSITGGTSVAGVWQHCVLTQSSTAGATLYLDGAVVGSNAAFTADNTGYTGGQNTLGNYDTGGSTIPYSGKMDQVRIFNTALTSAQINDLYTNEIACS